MVSWRAVWAPNTIVSAVDITRRRRTSAGALSTQHTAPTRQDRRMLLLLVDHCSCAPLSTVSGPLTNISITIHHSSPLLSSSNHNPLSSFPHQFTPAKPLQTNCTSISPIFSLKGSDPTLQKSGCHARSAPPTTINQHAVMR